MKKKQMKTVTVTICDGCHKDISYGCNIRTVLGSLHEFHFCSDCADTRDEQDTKSMTVMEAQVQLLLGKKIRHESWSEEGWVKTRNGNKAIISSEGSVEHWTGFWGHFKDVPKFKNGWQLYKAQKDEV